MDLRHVDSLKHGGKKNMSMRKVLYGPEGIMLSHIMKIYDKQSLLNYASDLQIRRVSGLKKDELAEKIANELYKENDVVLNLASNEYSKCIKPYLNDNRKMITCVFAQKMNGKLKTKPTEAKMCRGYMVRYMAERNIQDLEEIKKFDGKKEQKTA